MDSLMLELITTPPFLIVTAIFAVLIVIGIAKRAVRLLLGVTVIFVILIGLSFMNQTVLLVWFENMFKR